MDTKAAFDREAFEKFITDEAIKRNYQFMDNLFSKFGDDYSVTWVDMAWMGWTSSREAIEIDLPQRQSLCASGYGDGYFVPSSTGEGLEYDEVVEAITSHGIRIKGKTE